MMCAWVVMADHGSHYERFTWPVRIFLDEHEAKAFAEAAEAWLECNVDDLGRVTSRSPYDDMVRPEGDDADLSVHSDVTYEAHEVPMGPRSDAEVTQPIYALGAFLRMMEA